MRIYCQAIQEAKQFYYPVNSDAAPGSGLTPPGPEPIDDRSNARKFADKVLPKPAAGVCEDISTKRVAALSLLQENLSYYSLLVRFYTKNEGRILCARNTNAGIYR